MTATAHALFAVDASFMTIAVVTVLLFSAVIMAMMLKDYRIYMASRRKRRGSMADFIWREQFYIYLLIVLLLLIAGDVWRHGTQ